MKNIYYTKRNLKKPWRVTFYHHGKTYNVGYFATSGEAQLALKKEKDKFKFNISYTTRAGQTKLKSSIPTILKIVDSILTISDELTTRDKKDIESAKTLLERVLDRYKR